MNSHDLQMGQRLIIRHELRLVGAIELRGSSLIIGRSSQCDIRLQHEAVSRHHARLENRENGWHIVDLDSVNGVRVNGRRTKEARLSAGDVIEVRPFAMNFLAGTAEVDRSISLAASCESPTLMRENRPSGQVVRQRLADLYGLASLIIHRQDNGSFWQEIHAALQRSLVADRCILVGFDPAAGLYRLAPRARPAETEGPLVVSQSVLNDVIRARQAVLVRRVAEDDHYAAAESLMSSHTGSVICVPVLVSGQTRAVVYVERREGRPPFGTDDLDFVTAAVDMAAAAVDMDELQARGRELSRLRGRVEAGREVQEMLLPLPIPQPAWGHVAAKNVPADQVSGDIYDVVIDPQGRLVVSIADVSGKGIPAAFVTAILQNTFRQAVGELEALDEIVWRINATLLTYRLPACYVTMVICRWSASGDLVEVANCGHHAPLWVTSDNKIEAFPDRVGLALGIAPEWFGEIVSRDVTSLTAVLFSSDGATEAKNGSREEYGLERLGEELLRLASLDARTIVDSLGDAVRRFSSPNEPEDDLTLLVVQRSGAGPQCSDVSASRAG
jgi:phosphoserine phosphatase RsbU/P